MINCKQCFKCGEIKPLSAFYKHSRMADGRLNKCKECNKKDVQDNYRANIEYYKEFDKERNKRPKRIESKREAEKQWSKNNPEKVKKYKKKYREVNPEKYKAHNIVNNAIRDGRLIKGVCKICGAKDTHAHHEDYGKPLDVIWLCPQCHVNWHNGIRPESF